MANVDGPEPDRSGKTYPHRVTSYEDCVSSMHDSPLVLGLPTTAEADALRANMTGSRTSERLCPPQPGLVLFPSLNTKRIDVGGNFHGENGAPLDFKAPLVTEQASPCSVRYIDFNFEMFLCVIVPFAHIGNP